jgi:hypothetical protein
MNADEQITNWRDITYLRGGTARQRQAYQALSELRVLSVLHHYDPILVSTVCLDIATATSDLDIICEVDDHERFIADVTQHFGDRSGFSTRNSTQAPPATVIQFFAEDFEIELFGQALPVEEQAAYQHLRQTHRVIQLGGECWRSAIQKLKCGGMKTEPAVAYLLGLSGDPYQAVIQLKDRDDTALLAMITKASRTNFVDG